MLNTLLHQWQNVSFVTYHGPCGGTSNSQSQLLRRSNTMSMENPKANQQVCSSPIYKYSWSLQGSWRTDWKIKSMAMVITVSLIMLTQSRWCSVWVYAYIKKSLSPFYFLLCLIPYPSIHTIPWYFLLVSRHRGTSYLHSQFPEMWETLPFLCLLKHFLWNTSYIINLTKLHLNSCYCHF